MDYIHTTKAKLGIKLDIPLREHDPLDKLNDLANKKRKYAADIHDYFKANKMLKTFSSLLLAEVDKRNLNSLKQMRVIEQLRQQNKIEMFVSLLEGLQGGKKIALCQKE
nr:hypothetical protein [Tanacetum cinerariifolium]